MAGIFKNLDKSDTRLTPFRAYKRFSGAGTYTTYSAILSLADEQIDNSAFITPSDPNVFTSNGKSKNSVWHSIDGLFYRYYYTNPKASFDSLDNTRQPRLLHKNAFVISMPQSNYGEGIEPMSVVLSLNNGVTTTTFVDDIYGNLVPQTTTTLIPTASKVVFNTKPASHTRDLTQTFNKAIEYGTDLYPSRVEFNNILITSGSPFVSTVETRYQFTGRSNATSSIVIKPENGDINSLFNFTSRDFAIGFNYTPDASATNPRQLILEKYDTYTQPHLDLNGSSYNNATLQSKNNKFPYRLSYELSTQKLVFEKGSGLDTLLYTSSYQYTPGTNAMIARSGSVYYLRCNGNEETFTDTLYTSDVNCANDSSLYIGSTATGASGSNAAMGPMFFYDGFINSLTYDQIGYGTTYAENYVGKQIGNVFRKHGMIVVTDPQLVAALGSLTVVSLEYRGTTTIYENEISCTVSPGQLTRSTNPSMYYYNPLHNQFELSSFATGSGFTPYITRIGLYDDNNNLVVVGSLTQPIQLPDNVDTTFIIRYDV